MSCQTSNKERTAELTFLTCAPRGRPGVLSLSGGPNLASCSQHSGTPPKRPQLSFIEKTLWRPEKSLQKLSPCLASFPGVCRNQPWLVGAGLVVRLVHRSLDRSPAPFC